MGTLLTRNQVAKLCGVSHDTIRYWGKMYDLPQQTQRHGFVNRYYIDSEDLMSFVDEHGLELDREKLAELNGNEE